MQILTNIDAWWKCGGFNFSGSGKSLPNVYLAISILALVQKMVINHFTKNLHKIQWWIQQFEFHLQISAKAEILWNSVNSGSCMLKPRE